MKTLKKFWPVILFYGALWGIIEATLGFALQLPIFPHIASGLVMFPIAMTLLAAAYRRTQSAQSLLFIGLVAASIRAVNLFSPVLLTPWRTVNPMIAIVVESLLVLVVITVVIKRPWPQKVAAIMVASIGWRLTFMGVQGINLAVFDFVHVNLTSWRLFAEFTLLQGFLSGLVAVAFVGGYLAWVDASHRDHRMSWLKPHLAGALYVLALALTYIL